MMLFMLKFIDYKNYTIIYQMNLRYLNILGL